MNNHQRHLALLALALFSFATASISRADDPIAFDPFAPALTAYNVGDNLVGQTNAAGLTWAGAGTLAGTNNVVITNGNLSVTGLAASNGNSIQFGPSDGASARFGLNGAIKSNSVFYSFVFRVDNLGSLNTNGGFFAAFNNSSGTQTNTPSVIASGVQTRLSGTGYNIGLKKAASGSVFDSGVHNVGEVVFVVGSYTFNTATNTDDEADLWINPDPSTFGAATAPAPTLTSTNGADISSAQIASFVFFRRGTSNAGLEPASIVADELRVGTNWAGVTPGTNTAATPSPVPLNVSYSAGSAIITWPTNFSSWRLQGTSTLVNGSNAWTNVTAPAGIVGTNYSVTDPVSGRNYYRLIYP